MSCWPRCRELVAWSYRDTTLPSQDRYYNGTMCTSGHAASAKYVSTVLLVRYGRDSEGALSSIQPSEPPKGPHVSVQP
jgi:hypothetical protein